MLTFKRFYRSDLLRNILGSAWLFPALVAIILLTLAAAGIHGSSIGQYENELEGKSNSENCLVGQPRIVRADEWNVNTPFTISQSLNNYPVINEKIGSGQDMAVVIDVPYKEWSSLFRPQNLGFFILPLINAFAFKWWFLSAILALSVYIFAMAVLPSRRLAAVLLAAGAVLNPFTQWWYQSITLLPIAYTFLSITLALYILRSKNLRSRILLTLLLGYFLACFALIMYPPFQIPCAIAGLFIFVGLYFGEGGTFAKVYKDRVWLWYFAALILAAVIVTLFVLRHQEPIAALTNTIYPGERTVEAGGTMLVDFLTWPLSYALLLNGPETVFGSNQSEVARFMIFGIYLLPFLFFYFYRQRMKEFVNKKILGSLLVSSSFVLILFVSRSFIPYGDTVYHFLGLSSIPHLRSMIVLGILNIAFLIVIMGLPAKKSLRPRDIFDRHTITVTLYSSLLIGGGLAYIKDYYGLPSFGKLVLLSVTLYLAVALGLLAHKALQLRYIGLLLLIAFSIRASLQVNPLYRGFGPIQESNLIGAIQKHEKRDTSRWISVNSPVQEAVLVAAGAESFGGVETYPQTEFWSKHFPKSEKIHNRYAHITFTLDDRLRRPSLHLVQDDWFAVHTSSCDPFLKEARVDYILIKDSNSDYECFHQLEQITQGSEQFNILKRNTTTP